MGIDAHGMLKDPNKGADRQESEMKITTIAAAAFAFGLLAATPAVAQDRHDNGDHHAMTGDHHDGDRHNMRGDRHNMGGRHMGWHQHCRWMWRHHRHVRVCR
jgi:hypothetical protein